MTTAAATELGIQSMTDAELEHAAVTGQLDWAAVTAECDRRDAYRKRSRAARHAARKRAEPEGWSDAAHAQALELEQVTRGYVLSDYGARKIRGPVFPAVWHIADSEVDRYLTEEAINFFRGWPRLTVPAFRAQIAAMERDAEEEARAEAAPVARPVRPARPAPVPAAPGSIARYTAALSTLADHANAIAAAMARRNRR